MKKTSSSRKFANAREMDRALEATDLSGEFRLRGVVKKPTLRKINLDLPSPVIDQIDRIAEKVGVARQPLLKMWIHERLKTESTK